MSALRTPTFVLTGDARILWGHTGAFAIMDTKWTRREKYAATLTSANWRTPCVAAASVETHPVASK